RVRRRLRVHAAVPDRRAIDDADALRPDARSDRAAHLTGRAVRRDHGIRRPRRRRREQQHRDRGQGEERAHARIINRYHRRVRARVALLVVTVAGPRGAMAAASPDDEWREEWRASEAERGPIAKRRLEHDERVGRVPCKAKFDVGVDAKGRLVFCTTAAAVTLDGMPVAAETYSSFYPSGRVYQAQLAAAAHEFT